MLSNLNIKNSQENAVTENIFSPINDEKQWTYVSFFGLSQAPFSLTPDTSFFYNHESSQICLNTLLYAVRNGEGFTKVVGEVGTGKTLLCRLFLNSLDNRFVTAYIPNPYLGPMSLLLALADELGVAYEKNVTQHQLLKALSLFLIETYAEYKKVVIICLDEAHALPTQSLESLRLLSNLETSKRKLLQIVLFGQPELDNRLNHPAVRQLRQRISFSCNLSPLSRHHVEDYLNHRLSVAGYRSPRMFSWGAIYYIHKASTGIPRLINILAHKSMTVAFGEGSKLVVSRHVRAAIQDTESTQQLLRSLRASSLIKYCKVMLALLVPVAIALWVYPL